MPAESMPDIGRLGRPALCRRGFMHAAMAVRHIGNRQLLDSSTSLLNARLALAH